MDLYEYQGKQLFARFGIPVSDGRVALTPGEARAAAAELGGPVVVKAQVLTGGRGKAGGIKLAASPDEGAGGRARAGGGGGGGGGAGGCYSRARRGGPRGALVWEGGRVRHRARVLL